VNLAIPSLKKRSYNKNAKNISVLCIENSYLSLKKKERKKLVKITSTQPQELELKVFEHDLLKHRWNSEENYSTKLFNEKRPSRNSQSRKMKIPRVLFVEKAVCNGLASPTF